jgi:hypothetical protein
MSPVTILVFCIQEETESTLRLLAEKDVPAAAQQQQHEHDLDLYAAQKALAMDRMKPGRERFLPFSCTDHQAANNSRSSTPGSTAVNQGDDGIEF